MNVCLFFCSLYLVRVLIVVIMGRWCEFSMCIVCQVVRFYSVVEIVVMSGEVACCNNNNNNCLKSNVHRDTSSVDYQLRQLTHACSRM